MKDIKKALERAKKNRSEYLTVRMRWNKLIEWKIEYSFGRVEFDKEYFTETVKETYDYLLQLLKKLMNGNELNEMSGDEIIEKQSVCMLEEFENLTGLAYIMGRYTEPNGVADASKDCIFTASQMVTNMLFNAFFEVSDIVCAHYREQSKDGVLWGMPFLFWEYYTDDDTEESDEWNSEYVYNVYEGDFGDLMKLAKKVNGK